jgi:Asp-tRNA(Asn)/Glu-tRNA(Gln) amidotransferase A subunit family amidase
VVPAERAVAWLRALGEALRHVALPAERADLVHAIYERIVVAGPTFVRARLTPAAYEHGRRSRYRRLLERARQDSNLRPSAPEADALSTELQARGAR